MQQLETNCISDPSILRPSHMRPGSAMMRQRMIQGTLQSLLECFTANRIGLNEDLLDCVTLSFYVKDRFSLCKVIYMKTPSAHSDLKQEQNHLNIFNQNTPSTVLMLLFLYKNRFSLFLSDLFFSYQINRM